MAMLPPSTPAAPQTLCHLLELCLADFLPRLLVIISQQVYLAESQELFLVASPQSSLLLEAFQVSALSSTRMGFPAMLLVTLLFPVLLVLLLQLLLLVLVHELQPSLSLSTQQFLMVLQMAFLMAHQMAPQTVFLIALKTALLTNLSLSFRAILSLAALIPITLLTKPRSLLSLPFSLSLSQSHPFLSSPP
ncbi:hypothetical protein BGZ63DRAFT_244999 [Mariannaea sp. PMI_226]|nr:hypothetical protein BGZ63DRAFT_244999 [Mariannaea sp. PMI_226]